MVHFLFSPQIIFGCWLLGVGCWILGL